MRVCRFEHISNWDVVVVRLCSNIKINPPYTYPIRVEYIVEDTQKPVVCQWPGQSFRVIRGVTGVASAQHSFWDVFAQRLSCFSFFRTVELR